uniref:mRNA interferase RelE/StbE n=1 Tax=Candidatus Kentrum sp. TUN TaxID=2126343 RepID=A0A451AVH1_9GAMM|nr:MAG: mRNA interferase RelE/StbE [Candidatus Kentron sp. TUN]VFK64146.1 MAG: mRNA interferase RelE/StbE [Candidatus Kentron sp. TUN]VFK70025.1 MAG: mRNA interferase RelE/StbE [Candidatus Kentron sp. TUN]
MAEYSIFFRKSVEKDLSQILKRDLRRIIERIGALANDPRPPGCEKLSSRDRYRIRQGKYRILYSIRDKELTIWVVKVRHRRDVYR